MLRVSSLYSYLANCLFCGCSTLFLTLCSSWFSSSLCLLAIFSSKKLRYSPISTTSDCLSFYDTPIAASTRLFRRCSSFPITMNVSSSFNDFLFMNFRMKISISFFFLLSKYFLHQLCNFFYAKPKFLSSSKHSQIFFTSIFNSSVSNYGINKDAFDRELS